MNADTKYFIAFLRRWRRIAVPVAAAVLALIGAAVPAAAASSDALTVFAAGTLAVPFRALVQRFEKQNQETAVHAEFGGSVKMVRQIVDLHRPADILAVADYNVIPKYLFAHNGHKGLAGWYVGFAGNAITFVYTDKSKYAKEVDARNWYKMLARSGVVIGRSDPDTDPSGYQTVQMLDLAARYYNEKGLAKKILANSPPAAIRDTETSLIAALQLGQIDYLAIYRSDAIQHHFRYLKLPPQIDLSDPEFAAEYRNGVAHTANGDLPGRPIVYAVTIPSNAPHPQEAAEFLALLLGDQGRSVMSADGFAALPAAYAVNLAAMPASLRKLAKPWPH
ncbi:MAG TPA: extracellular solute-binding protein [Stellaceae bacterium]|nr:extracellular solute-binding protein [Stellaceae bacterium]